MNKSAISLDKISNASRRYCPSQVSVKLALLIASAMPVASQAATYTSTVQTGSNPEVVTVTSTPGSYSSSMDGAVTTVDLSDAGHGTITSRSYSPDGTPTGSSGVIQYSFQLDGPPDVYVPLRVQAHGYAVANGAGALSSQAIFKLFYVSPLSYPYPYGTIIAEADANDSRTGPIVPYADFAVDQVIQIRSDYLATVLIATSAEVGFFGPGTGTAFVDPIFTIDPAYAGRFTITGLPGPATPPVGGVPEPSSWALLLCGFGMVGGTLRRRQPVNADSARSAAALVEPCS